ncbi:MAG: flagellar brake protein [Burkholderiales bacterium]|jgi:c-di-GMP-binding flagellar brake protein YcgR
MADESGEPLEIEPAAADHSKYLIHSRLEIAVILGTLCKAGTMVTAYFGRDNDFILTSIIAVRPDQGDLVVEYGADAAANQRALQAGNLTFVAAHERIKIQFVADSLRPVRTDGRDALRAPLPASLLRLQRREYFRIATPLVRPLRCVIGPQAAAPGAPAEVTVVDISCGGIAITDSSSPAGIEPGVCFRRCRILLPEIGEVRADIMVRSTFEVMLKNGAKHKRAGCEFVDMSERDRALIQRYISRLERERKDRSGAR